MQTSQQVIKSEDYYSINTKGVNPNLILIFGGSKVIVNHPVLKNLRSDYPEAIITGCSTSGEIGGENVYDDTLSISYTEFENTRVVNHAIDLNAYAKLCRR